MTEIVPTWTAREGLPLKGKASFGLLGILNITPDSFYDGGICTNAREYLKKAESLIHGGADILDLGAESTRPGANPVEPSIEQARLLPILAIIREKFPFVPISVDTRNSLTASHALARGAHIINDISGCCHDPAMPDVLAQFKPGYILMHSQGNPQNMQIAPSYKNVIFEIMRFFEEKMNLLVKNGLPENRIALDPGIGFGKSLSHNIEILRNIRAFKVFGRPVVAALSMKSIFGELFGHNLNERAIDTAVASVLLKQKGIYWHRIHCVDQVAKAFQLDEILDS